MGKLIRLELYNFKSYKGHHILLFGDSYFTSIIGPNGSGKSNSMDAISFVLGIKSSHLRSAHLRDLVYRGRVLKTSKINDDGSAAAPAPNGDANGDDADEETQSSQRERNDPKTAWVMAVYEDDAGDEQKWKRSITSQGASEYRINDRTCTAQQYNEALESENILIKARNFLVFQGDVEAIASQSPKDLTRLIEQISGSLEFKAEYERLEEESTQAAEEQTYNLHRRRGINSEIKQYQEQKKEAESYQNKVDERDQAIITHIQWKLYHLQRVMEESSASIQEHQENLKEYRRGKEKYDKALEEAQKDYARVNKDLSKVERNIKRKEKEIEEKENNLFPINEKLQYLRGQLAVYQQKYADIEKDREDNAEAVEKLKKSLATIDKAQKKFESDWAETLKKKGKQLSAADFKEYTDLRRQVLAKTSDDQLALKNLVRQMKTDELTANTLKGKMETLQANMERLEAEHAKTIQRRDTVRAKVEQLTKDIDAKKKSLSNMKSERVRNNQRRTELEEKYRAVLRELSEADEGRRQSDKEVRQKEMVTNLKRIYPGVRGRVGDLCKPKQKKYEEAVGTALGRDFESVIVDTEKTGTDCVQYLKDQRFGPMTFIPLDNIKVNVVNSNLKNLPKARLTIDTIDFDSSLERAMSYACGSSIVCDDIATAKHICFQKNIQVKAVTLDGTVIHKAGLITGGRGNDRGKRRFDSKDGDRLRAIADKQRLELENCPSVTRRSGDEERCEMEVTSLQQELEYQKREFAAFEKNIASQEKVIEDHGRSFDDIEPKFEEKNAEVESLRRKVEEFQNAVSKVEDKIFSEFCKRLDYANIRDYEAQQGALEQEAEEKRNEFKKQKQTLTSQLAWQKNNLEAVQRRSANIQSSIDNLEQQIEEFQAEKEIIERDVDEDRAEITALEDDGHKQKEKLLVKSEKVTTARHESNKRQKEIERRNKDILALQTEAQSSSAKRYALLRRCKLEQIAIPLTTESKKLDSLPADEALAADPDDMDVDDEEPKGNVAKTYGIEVDFSDFDDDLQDQNEHIEDQLLEKISSLNSELEKLNPNMRAVDRLDGVESRLKSTEKDFEDARKAAKASKDAFNEVKKKRYDLFNKAFGHITDQIQHVYKDLTRSSTFPLGGSAYLDIEDSDAPYLSGIKYHAMPPLKRFRDMEHLSGGEKTMAALALLFAIHSYQPSPFFVLDEVDAALDNANVEKIRNYIKEHSGPGMQFIVISLKTGLFQGSESLVGVYRDQEVNSSKAMTLDLRKYGQ